MQEMKLIWFVYPFCSIFMLAGTWLSLKALSQVRKAKEAQSWPTVQAELSACELLNTSDGDAIVHEVEVTYHYTVNKQLYTSSRIHPAYSSSSASGHENLYHKLNTAAVVEAFYDPKDPSVSFLITETYGFHKAGVFGGLIFFSAGLFFMLIFHFALGGSSNYADGLTVIKLIEGLY
jgi:hypothetical protein|tara:strand:+ start:1771 stop:2301 length:531 start_codon:yes stop_codon:yes gene_type:complete